MRLLIAFALAFSLCAHAMPASELIGKRVVDPAREDLGKISGLFDKQFAFPIEAFTLSPYGDTLLLDRRKALLLVVPGVDSTGVPDAQAELWRGIDRWYARDEDRRGLPLLQFVRARVLLGRDVVDRTGEPLGELVDLDMRREPLSMLRVPASGEAIVFNIHSEETR